MKTVSAPATISKMTVAFRVAHSASSPVKGRLAIKPRASSVISGTAASSVTKFGSGTLTLAGNNTYTGTTNVNGGKLSVASINSTATTAQPLGQSTSAINLGGGTLEYTGVPTATLNRGVNLTAAGTRKDVAIVNQAFARKYFPGENPLGRQLLTGDRKEKYEIVGVVSDYRAMGAENGARAEIFRRSLEFTSATLVVRSRGAPQSVERPLLDAALSVTPDVPADRVRTLDEDADRSTSQRRFNTLLLEIFAGLALVLAVMGIYGVLSNLVTSRTREIGIRIAVGATPGAIGRLVLRQSMVPVAIGLIIGLAGGVAIGRLMGSLLFQVRSWDPLTLAAAVTSVLLTSPAALWLPLRRATAVDCTVALREE